MKFCNAHKVGWLLGGSMTLVNFNVRRWVGRCPMFSPSFPATKPKRFPFCRLRSKTHPPSLSSLLSRAPTTRHSDNGWLKCDWIPSSLLIFFRTGDLGDSREKYTGLLADSKCQENNLFCPYIHRFGEGIFLVGEWMLPGAFYLRIRCFALNRYCEPILTLLSPAIAHKTWQKPEEKKGEVGRLPSYSHPETGDDCKTAIGRNFYWLANHIYCFLFANSIYSPIFLFWSIASHGLLYFPPYSLGQWPGKDENIIHAIFYG